MESRGNLTHDDVLRLVEVCLGDFGITLKLCAYRTHTGDAFVRPWTGPIAWEVSASTTLLPRDGLVKLVKATEALGLHMYISHEDEDSGAIRFERLKSHDATPSTVGLTAAKEPKRARR